MDFFDNEQVGKRLRHLRCIMDISVSEMADSLGVTTGHFRKWERGDHAISLVGLDMLHRLYGMDLNYLITGKVREQDFANALFEMSPEEFFFMMRQILESTGKEKSRESWRKRRRRCDANIYIPQEKYGILSKRRKNYFVGYP